MIGKRGIIALAVLAGAAMAARSQGDEAQTFRKVCVSCHNIETVGSERHSRSEWLGVAEDMVSRGADATAEEKAVIIDYLTKNYGNIPINKLTAGDLEKEMNLTAAEAGAIVKWRTENGSFPNFEALRKVSGAPVSKLESYRNSLVF